MAYELSTFSHREEPTSYKSSNHSLTLQPLAGISREYLLARFAIAIFDKLIFSRLRSGMSRRLVCIPALGKPSEEKDLSAALQRVRTEGPESNPKP